MPRKERPAQQEGQGNGGGYHPQWQPQHPPTPPTPEQRAQYEAGPGRYMPHVTPQGMPIERQAGPSVQPNPFPGFEAGPGGFMKLPVSFTQPSFPPAPSGQTPTGVTGLAVPLPIGSKATHFAGPIVSGGIPQTPPWPDYATAEIGGSATLTTFLAIDYSMGNFTVPVQFPPDALIIGFTSMTAVAFTAPPSFQLGTTSGASDIATGTLPAPGGPTTFQPAAGQLPLWGAAPPQAPFLTYLTVAGNTGGTAGLGFAMIQYIRIPQRWT